MDGLVTQITSLATPVTINVDNGIITTFLANTASGAVSQFTVNNAAVHATSNVQVSIIGYAGAYTTNGLPDVSVQGITAGSFSMVIQNPHGTNALNGALQIGFRVV